MRNPMTEVTHPLAKEREMYGVSQKELAERAGVSKATIGNIENLRSDPSTETLKRVSLALDEFARSLVGA